MTKPDLKGLIPESWHCVDCGVNTAPGCLNKAEMENAMDALGDKWASNEEAVGQTLDDRSEVYTVRAAVWEKAGMGLMGGCLCIGCLEKRLGRILRPKDFLRGHPFNQLPGSPRLLERQGR